MTTRLLCRWASLLPRCPQASVVATRLQAPLAPLAPLAHPLEPLRPQAWPRPTFRPLCQGRGLAEEEEEGNVFKRTELDDLLDKAQCPEDVLKAWAECKGTANQAASSLIHISYLPAEKNSPGRQELLQDPGFAGLLKSVTTQVESVWNGNLVNLLRSLLVLQLPPESEVVRSIQTEVLWRLRRLSYRQLALAAGSTLGQTHKGREQQALATALLKQLELRWAELTEPRTVSTLMRNAAHLPPTLMEKLEDKALELAEQFRPEDIRRVALALALHRRRSVPLLRALSYHLQQRPFAEMDTSLLLDIAFAYGKLNFHQIPVFQKMATELLPRLPQLSSTKVMRCAKSFAFLKWLHLPLFEGLAEHYVSNSDKYNTLQLCNLIMSMAKLNFQPSKGDRFYAKVHSALEDVLPTLEPFLRIDVVWSLCVLQQAKLEYINALTDPAFQTKLIASSVARTENYHLKLLHIIATAELELQGSQGGAAGAPPVQLLPSRAQEPSPTPLQSGLHAALRGLTGERTQALRTSVDTVYGWTLDGVVVVDSENKPIDLENLTIPHLAGGEGAEPIPQGAQRVAFVAWEFPSFASKSKDLLGRFAMQKRHLQLAGFLLVEVPYFEWLELKSDWQKLAYLKDKMGKAVAEEMAK